MEVIEAEPVDEESLQEEIARYKRLLGLCVLAIWILLAYVRWIVALLERTCIHWKQQAHFWESMFRRAKEKAAATEAALRQRIAALEAELRRWDPRERGRSTETTYPGAAERPRGQRKRGHARGQPPPPRRDHSHLPVVEETLDVPAEQRCCATCGEPYTEFPGTDDGEILEIDVRAYRRRYRRRRYRRG